MYETTFAVFSDIHSNYHALKACYADAAANGAERFLFLGDFVSDLAEPARTMDLVYEIRAKHPTICLRGNRERYMLEHHQGTFSFAPGSKTGSLLFTYTHLRRKDLDFYRSLPISNTVSLSGIDFALAHASMDDDHYYFEDHDARIERIFQQMNCSYLLTGHSHKQFIAHRSGKTIVNPGSVGIPQRGSRNAQYALMKITGGDVTFVFREVPYDLNELIHAQFASGLVDAAKYWAIGILYDVITGEEWVLKLLNIVQQTDPLSESEWHRAAMQLGIKLTEEEILSLIDHFLAE